MSILCDVDLDIQKLAVTLAEECRENKSIDLMLCTLYDVKYRIAASEVRICNLNSTIKG